MNLLAGLFLYLGYVLVYAATADHGRFATHPWLGVIADAYTGETIGRSSSSSSSSSSSPDASSSSGSPVQRAALVTHGAGAHTQPLRRRGVAA